MNLPEWIKQSLIIGCRIILGCVFLSTGIIKVLDIQVFVDALQAYHILPKFLINPFAFAIPWLEIVIGMCFIIGFWAKSGAFLALSLLTTFAIGLGVNLVRGVDMSCGCFGPYFSDESLSIAMFRIVILMGMSAVIIKCKSINRSSCR